MVKLSDFSNGKVENKRRKLLQGAVWATPIVAGVSLPQHAHASAPASTSAPASICQSGQVVSFSRRADASPNFMSVEDGNYSPPFDCMVLTPQALMGFSDARFGSPSLGPGYNVSLQNGDFTVVFEQYGTIPNTACGVVGDSNENFYAWTMSMNMENCVLDALNLSTAVITKADLSLIRINGNGQNSEGLFVNASGWQTITAFNTSTNLQFDLLDTSIFPGLGAAYLANELVANNGTLHFLTGDDSIPVSSELILEITL